MSLGNCYYLLKNSFVDYPGMVAAVLFFGGCNFHCPYCHNPHLVNLSDSEPQVSFNEYTDYIRKMRGLVDAVVLSGGEPTLCPDLSLWIDPARQYGYSVKLDTNGSNPEAVQKHLQKLSCVGLDFKLPVDRYYEFGNETSGEKWLKTLDIVLNAVNLKTDIRTTVHPDVLSYSDLMSMRDTLLEHGARQWTLQQFHKVDTLLPEFGVLPAYSDEELLGMAEDLETPELKLSVRGLS